MCLLAPNGYRLTECAIIIAQRTGKQSLEIFFVPARAIHAVVEFDADLRRNRPRPALQYAEFRAFAIELDEIEMRDLEFVHDLLKCDISNFSHARSIMHRPTETRIVFPADDKSSIARWPLPRDGFRIFLRESCAYKRYSPIWRFFYRRIWIERDDLGCGADLQQLQIQFKTAIKLHRESSGAFGSRSRSIVNVLGSELLEIHRSLASMMMSRSSGRTSICACRLCDA